MKYLIILLLVGCVPDKNVIVKKTKICARICSSFDTMCQTRPEYSENFCVKLPIDKKKDV